MLTGSQVRAARMRVMNATLVPLGFVQQGSMYAHKAGGQIHGIAFHASKDGREYTVNSGFHFKFLPCSLCFDHNPFEEFEIVDFFLYTRIGHLPTDHDVWWPYTDMRGDPFSDCINHFLDEAAPEPSLRFGRC